MLEGVVSRNTDNSVEAAHSLASQSVTSWYPQSLEPDKILKLLWNKQT